VTGSLTVGVLKENLAVNTARADQGGIERLDLVRRHDDLDITTVIETVQLVEELQHGALNLALAAWRRLVSLGADGVDLVDEDDGGCILRRGLEQLSDKPWTVSKVLLDQLAAHDAQERCARLVRHRLGE
jgi:hypothetical protein